MYLIIGIIIPSRAKTHIELVLLLNSVAVIALVVTILNVGGPINYNNNQRFVLLLLNEVFN